MKDNKIIITGRIIRGVGYGQKLGFPTANLDRRGYSHLKCKPRSGVYAGTVRILHSHSPLSKGVQPSSAGDVYPAAIIIGPKDNKGLPKIEAHLIDFSGVLYGARVKLSLMKYLRPFMSFRNENVLKKQILKDIRSVQKILA